MALLSAAERLASLPETERNAFLDSLTKEQAQELMYDWRGFLARPDQIAPEFADNGEDWDVWIALAGRGWGKTETGAQWVRELAEDPYAVIALVAETAFDARSVMVKRLMSIFPNPNEIDWEPSKRMITFPSGAVAFTYNGTEPDQLRGPEHSAAWCDELAKWRYAREAWDQLQFGLRVGDHPRVLVTTTPRPIEIIRNILNGKEGRVATTRGRTLDNRSNLPPRFLERITGRYAGTRLGRQELEAEVLDDIPGALWTRDILDQCKVDAVPTMKRIVVAVDPSGTKGDVDEGDEIGIVVVGLGVDGHCYVLADLTIKAGPFDWGTAVVSAYNGEWAKNPRAWRADRVIAETNFGGAMVEYVIRTVDDKVSFKAITASRGKIARAEPVSALYAQGKVHHLAGTDKDGDYHLNNLEDQMTLMHPAGYQGEGSPDRADAAVWGISELMLGEQVEQTEGALVGLY